MKRWPAALFVTGGIAVALAFFAPSAVAPGHGSVVSPASRVYRVYKSNPERPNFPLAVKAVQLDGMSSYYTWNEVSRNIPAAVKAKLPPGFDYSKWVPDGQLASAGRVDRAKFPRTYRGLDQVSADWPKTPVVAGQAIDVDFQATAAHSPSVWDVWMTTADWRPDTPLRWSHMEFLGRPKVTATRGHYKFKVTIPRDRAGHHVLWVVWQRDDPVGEAFFSTSDLLVRPANDDCAAAIVVRDGENGEFSIRGATASLPAASCGGKGGDVWYEYTASCTGTLRVDACGAGFDSIVSIWSGACGSLVQIGCNDDACGTASIATAPVQANARYFIKVGGRIGKPAGEFGLKISYDNRTGSFTRASRGCGPAILQATGAPNLGGFVRYAVTGSRGRSQLLWVGLSAQVSKMCTGCDLGTPLTVVLPGDVSGMIPCDARLIGVSWWVQGADVGGSTGGSTGGCRFGGGLDFTLTDTVRTLVGR